MYAGVHIHTDEGWQAGGCVLTHSCDKWTRVGKWAGTYTVCVRTLTCSYDRWVGKEVVGAVTAPWKGV